MLTEHEIQSVLIANLNALMRKEGVSQSEIARRASIEKQTVSSWMRGVSFPSAKNIQSIVDAFGITTDDLLSLENGLASKERFANSEIIKPSYSYHIVPMLGNVAAGEWREVYEQHGEAVTIPDEFAESHPRAFGVKPAGSSMDLVFRDDEIAICDPDMEVRDGSVALVGVNGDEATIKRVFFAGNTIVLHAESTMADEYPDIAINTKDPASPPVHLIGEIFWKTLPARPIKF